MSYFMVFYYVKNFKIILKHSAHKGIILKLLLLRIFCDFFKLISHIILHHITSFNYKIKIIVHVLRILAILLSCYKRVSPTVSSRRSEVMYFRLDWTGENWKFCSVEISRTSERVATGKIDCIVPREFRVWWLRTDLNLERTILNTLGLTSTALRNVVTKSCVLSKAGEENRARLEVPEVFDGKVRRELTWICWKIRSILGNRVWKTRDSQKHSDDKKKTDNSI